MIKKIQKKIEEYLEERPLAVAIWSFIITALSFIVIGALVLLPKTGDFKGYINATQTSASPVGDTFNGLLGPFIALLVAVLTFLAFYIQYIANEQQKSVIKSQQKKEEIEKLETKFFEMIKLHRENVGELSYSYFDRRYVNHLNFDEIIRQTAISRKVFKLIYYDFKKLNDELSPFFKVQKEKIYQKDYLEKLDRNSTINSREFDLVSYAKIDILYCILYFGLRNEDDINTLMDLLGQHYRKRFIAPIIAFASLKPKEESKNWEWWVKSCTDTFPLKLPYLMSFFNSLDEKDEIDGTDEIKSKIVGDKILPEMKYLRYYGGHQFRLGHYFRNLYQAVNFINQSNLIGYRQKYSNIKLLRGQLSTYEQAILFFNSLSILGRKWELENRETPDKAIDVNHQLITKYNFIKNILNDEIVEDISVSHFYPLVEFEANFSEEKKQERELLKEKYT